MAQQTVRLKVDGMHCRSCSMNVDLTLDDIGGVASSETDLDSGISVVVFDDDVVGVDVLIAAVKEAGYEAVMAS